MNGGNIFENVLILQTSFLGDTVLTLPLISEIKRRFSPGRVTVLCSPLGKQLLRGHPDIDELLVDDKRHSDRGWRGLRRKAAALREMHFTLAVTPHKSLRSALLLYLSGIPRRVGFRQSKGWFLFHDLAERRPELHDVERNLSLLEPLGGALENGLPRLCLPTAPESKRAVRELFAAAGVDTAKVLIGVNPGSVWPTKRWSAEGFSELILILKNRYDCEVLLFGGPEDAAVAAAIHRRTAGASVNLAGRISLGDLPAALSECRVLITNDSGPMHIAAACNVPVVAIFCATTPALGFYPYSADSVVVGKALSCRPCAAHGGRRCPLGTEDCSRLVPAEQVLRAVETVLERRTAGAERDFRPEYVLV